jgi:hypothetical protein
MQRTCEEDACDRPNYAKGMCKSHYNMMILKTRPESAAKRTVYIRRRARFVAHGDYGPDGLLRQKARGLTCSVLDCERPVRARGWCELHYNRWKRHGDPEFELITEDRFWAMTDRRGDDECWPWTGRIGDNGYAHFKADGQQGLAHRWAYEHFVGPIPAGYTIDHVRNNGCTIKHCVNWLRHLEAVTQKENDRRAREYMALVRSGRDR